LSDLLEAIPPTFNYIEQFQQRNHLAELWSAKCTFLGVVSAMAQAAWAAVENTVPTTVVRESTDIFAALFAAELGSAATPILTGETELDQITADDPIPEQQKQEDSSAPNALVMAAALSVTAPAIVLTPEPIPLSAESVSDGSGEVNELSPVVTPGSAGEALQPASSLPEARAIAPVISDGHSTTPAFGDTLADQDFAAAPQREQ